MIATDTKSLILAAAIELFALNGYEKTTMRSIAEQVHIRSASIYYFYQSKEHLLDTIFEEFETNFHIYRNPPRSIFRAAETQPLPQVLSMIFYTFGNPDERERMKAIARIIMSLQYENPKALALFERVVVQDAMDYGVEVLDGLRDRGFIRDTDTKCISSLLHAYALAVFQQSLRDMESDAEISKDYVAGIRLLCTELANILQK